MFPVERIPEIEKAPDDFRLLQRVPWTSQSASFPHYPVEPVGDEIAAVWLDTETTGFSDDDVIIELGLVRGRISPSTGQVTAITAMASFFEDPGFPIPAVVTQITGITDQDVKGKSIDPDEVAQWLEDDPIVIAHNSKFDRPFFERRFAGLDNLRWACTIADVPWAEFGFESSKLEYLLLKLGYFFEGHHASIDALATAFLMHAFPKASRQLIENEQSMRVKLHAIGCPFSEKDHLKARGYRWDADNKLWHSEVAEGDLEEELAFLSMTYHRGGDRAQQTPLSSRERYKAELA